jgi:hypothetical protein
MSVTDRAELESSDALVEVALARQGTSAPGMTPAIIAVTIATLGTVSTTLLLQGCPAIVNSVGGLWTYQPAGTSGFGGLAFNLGGGSVVAGTV